ncbi:head-tail joining protein of prophage [Escherichia coli]|uniref:Head-tail joining protein of prophage n=1 Tax=Escherichia coli TaxID=562 RepID=A0A376U225_ECOLX|nr:head-tail joining protein of prophage [Escherichia coli]
MGISAQFTSGAQRGGEVQGVFDDPESLGFASSGIRIEGSSPSLFVRTDTVRAVRRGDTLTINGETFWVIVFLRMTGAVLSLAEPWATTRS